MKSDRWAKGACNEVQRRTDDGPPRQLHTARGQLACTQQACHQSLLFLLDQMCARFVRQCTDMSELWSFENFVRNILLTWHE